MHQYTAGLANEQPGSVSVLGSRRLPLDRFAPQVSVRAEIDVQRTGLHPANFNRRTFGQVLRTILTARPDVVHFTGPHLWNPLLLRRLRQAGIPTVHTLHDLDPHSGAGYGRLLYAWNSLVLRWADHILVHGRLHRDRLLARGLAVDRVTTAPLLHLFMNYEHEQKLRAPSAAVNHPLSTAEPFVLFFARLERYKGVDGLIEAMRLIEQQSAMKGQPFKAILAGQGNWGKIIRGPLPDNVEVRARLIEDIEAIDLFQRCSLVVLPYRDATQSAIIAAAYFFGKPVIVTRTGALPEYVIEGETGWIVPPADPAALAIALQQALSEPDRLMQRGAAGQAWYTLQRHEERNILAAMYARLLEQRSET